jgi:hypothetical protein
MAKNSKTFTVYRENESGDLIKVGQGKGFSGDAALVNAAEEENSVLEADVDYVVLGPAATGKKQIAIETKPKITVKGSGRGGKRGRLSEEDRIARAEKARATREANKAKKLAEANGTTEAAPAPAADANPFEGEKTA